MFGAGQMSTHFLLFVGKILSLATACLHAYLPCYFDTSLSGDSLVTPGWDEGITRGTSLSE